MQNNNSPLGNTSLEIFLEEFWQKQYLLIPNALPNFKCPITADEMAGLACEAEIESRIILEHAGEHPWQCRHGPFEESEFSQLPESNWCLLLQSCNLHLNAFAKLLDQFRFIPNWRVDDIMLSYAAPGGSVGPHTDNYDVFLLQAQGTRRWEISSQSLCDSDFLPNLDLKILKSFKAEQSWQLTPGDMLYLPPGIAHHGIAEDDGDDCITISIGFRAPNYNELSTALLNDIDQQQDSKSQFNFYSDPKFPLQDNSGEISSWALERINKIVRQEISDKINENDWFGKYITQVDESAQLLEPQLTHKQCLQQLASGQHLVRNEYSKLAFTQNDKHKENQIQFYCNGKVEYYAKSLLPIISLACNHRYPPFELTNIALEDKQAELFLCHLINLGHFYFEQDL